MLREIVLPETKPETEWVAGRPLQKVSPTFDHASVQKAMLLALDAWVGDSGVVQPEWRFRVEPPGEPRRPLVPDVAYVAAERIRHLSRAELQAPALAPDVVVEVLSPDDRARDVAAKVEVYLRAGSRLVIVLDPTTRTADLHDGGDRVQHIEGDAVLTHDALPGFRVALDAFFERALRRP